MTDTAHDEIDKAVEAALEPEKLAAEQNAAMIYPIEGVDLGPAFQAIIDKLLPLRSRLLKSVSSSTARNFADQRADLVELQSLTRAFDVLAGFVSPDGRMLSPMVEPDPEQASRRGEQIEEAVVRSGQQMQTRAKTFSNVPIEPMRAERRGIEPPLKEDVPGFFGRRRAVA